MRAASSARIAASRSARRSGFTTQVAGLIHIGIHCAHSSCRGRPEARRGPESMPVISQKARRAKSCGSSVGYIKTHHVAYLPEDQHRLVGMLRAGQRTPVFCMGTTWSRYSWYLRLPGVRASLWTGIVRCEATADLAPAAAIILALLGQIRSTAPRG